MFALQSELSLANKANWFHFKHPISERGMTNVGNVSALDCSGHNFTKVNEFTPMTVMVR